MRILIKILKALGILVAILALLFGAFIAWVKHRLDTARTDSTAFCAQYPVGSDIAPMLAAAQARRIIYREYLDQDQHQHEFTFPTVFLGSMKCTVTVQDGRISASQTSSHED